MARPNILFVLADQMRPDSLGQATPHINALASRGVRFENCYTASPLCQPARACIVTGKFPTSHGVCGNVNEPISMAERQDTFMQHLRQAGYHTALIGKHHYYDRFAAGMDVLEDDEDIKGYGFDHVWQAGDDTLRNEDRFTRYLREKGRLEEWRREVKQAGAAYYRSLEPGESKDGYIGECALEYIRDYDREAPLYLNVGFTGPHPPHWAVGKYAEMFDPSDMPMPLGVTDPAQIEAVRQRRAQYLGKVRLVDDYVGRLCEALEAQGMLENTCVVFSSDHGDTLGDHGTMDKRFFYEQSATVPLVMAGPGIDLQAREWSNVCKALANNVDLYPTFLAMAGCEHILGDSQRDGINLLDMAYDRAPRRGEVYSELGTAMMVRDANWKLVYDGEQGGVQYLFNLRSDPDELANLAGVAGYEAIEAELTRKLLTRLIKLTHHTQAKEQDRIQRVRV